MAFSQKSKRKTEAELLQGLVTDSDAARKAGNETAQDLKLITTTKASQRVYDVWSNRFKVYLHQVLHKAEGYVPTSDDVVAFWPTIATVGTIEGTPNTLENMEKASRALKKYLHFQYPPFTYTEDLRLRIQSMMRHLIDTAAACCARAGDIPKSHHAETEECLGWRDVLTRFTRQATEASFARLEMEICLRALKNNKGHNGGGLGETVFLGSVNNNNLAFPIKWLLIVAIRLGYLQEKTLQHVLDTGFQSKDRTLRIGQEFSGRPAFPDFSTFSEDPILELRTPVGVDQIDDTVRKLALKRASV